MVDRIPMEGRVRELTDLIFEEDARVSECIRLEAMDDPTLRSENGLIDSAEVRRRQLHLKYRSPDYENWLNEFVELTKEYWRKRSV